MGLGIGVPMLFIADKGGVIMKGVYAAVLYMAMITTAVSSGFALLDFLNRRLCLNATVLPAIMCAVSVPLAYVGFAELVDKLYRFFGFLGVFVLVLVLLDGIKLKIWKK